MAEISSGDSRPLLKDLNKHIVCGLCNGYLVDATTVTDCLHSFCRSCIVRQLQVSDVCPTCHKLGEVGPTTTLKSLRRDCLLQVLVYKLVPALYQREGRERRKFRRRNSRWRGDVSSSRPEDRHDGASISGSGISIRHGSVIYVDQETINLRLEPRDTNSPNHDITSDFAYGRKGTDSVKHLEDTESQRTLEGTDRYFLCPVLLTIKLLKKFMRYKFSLEENCQIDLFYCEEPLLDSYTLADLGYIFWSEKTTCMTIQYVIWKRISNDLYVSDTLLNKGNPECVTEFQDRSVGEPVPDDEQVSVEGDACQNGDRVTERNGDRVAESDVSSTSAVLQIDGVDHVDCLSESVINVCDKVNSVNDVIQPSVLKVDQNECVYNSVFVHGVSSNSVSPIGQTLYETGWHGQFQMETLEKDSYETAPEQREPCETSLDRLVSSEEGVVTSRIGTGARVCGASTQHLTASSKQLHSDEDLFGAKRHKGESSQFLTKNDNLTENVLEPSSCGAPTNTDTNNVCITLGNRRQSSHDQGEPQNSTNGESARNSANAFHGLFAINPSWAADRSDKNHNICRENHCQSDVRPTDIDCVDVCCDGEVDDDDDNHDSHPIDDDQEGSVEVHEADHPPDVVYNRVQDMGISTSPMFCEDEQIQHCLENLDVVSNSNSSSSADFSLNDIVDISKFSSRDLCQNSSNDMEFNHFEALARNNAKEREAVESVEQIHNPNDIVTNSGSLDTLDTNARSPDLTGGYGEQQYTAVKDDSCVSPCLVIDPEKLGKKSVTWNLSEEPSESEHNGFNDGESSSIITSTPSSSCDSQASVATQTVPDLICRYFSRRTAPLGLYSCNKKNSPKVAKPPRKPGLSSKFYQSSKTGNSEKNTLKTTQPAGFTITSQSNVFPTFNGKNAFVITFPGNTTSMLSDNCRPRVTLFAPQNGNVATVSPVTPPLTPVNHQTDGQTICSSNSLSVPILPASAGINPVVSGRNGVKSRSSGVNVTPNLARLLPAPIIRESRPSPVLSSTATSVYTFNDNISQNKPESDRLYGRGTKKDGSKGVKNSKCTTQDPAHTPTTVINICQNGIQTTPNLTTTDNGPRRPTIIFLPPMASSNACNPANAIAVLLPVSSSANNANAPRLNAMNGVQRVNIAPALNSNNINAPRLDGINSVQKVNIAPAVNSNHVNTPRLDAINSAQKVNIAPALYSNNINAPRLDGMKSIQNVNIAPAVNPNQVNAPRLDAINSAQKVNIAPAINANNIQVNIPPLVRNTEVSKPEMPPTKTPTETRFPIQQTSSVQTAGAVSGVSSQCVNQARATVFMNNSVLGTDKIGQGCITRTPVPPVNLNNGIVKNSALNGVKNQLEPILCVNKTSQREKVNRPKKRVRFDMGTEDDMLGSPEIPEKHDTHSVNAEINDNSPVVAESMEREKISPIKGLPILTSIINSDVIYGNGDKPSEIKLSVANVGSGGNVIVTSCKEKQACSKAFVSTNEMSQFLQKAMFQQNAQRLAQATPEHLQLSVPSTSLKTQSSFHTSQEVDQSGSPPNFGNMTDQPQAFEQTKSPSPSGQKSTLNWTDIDRQDMLSAARLLTKPCSVALPKKVYAYLGSALSHEHIARERDSPNEATQNLLKNIDSSPTQDKTSLYLPPADQLEMSEPGEDPQPINQLRLMCKELQNTIPPSPEADASSKRSPSGRRTRKRKSCTNCCQPAAELTNSDRKVARC